MVMIKAPYKDRSEFWKFQSAAITFFETKQLCDLILKEKIDPGHPFHASLMTALHILYGRPFKQQRTEAKLSDEIIPPEFKETHKGLILMRDKIYAHIDADGPKTANNEIMNKIAVRINNGAVQFNLAMLFQETFRGFMTWPISFQKIVGIMLKRFGRNISKIAL